MAGGSASRTLRRGERGGRRDLWEVADVAPPPLHGEVDSEAGAGRERTGSHTDFGWEAVDDRTTTNKCTM